MRTVATLMLAILFAVAPASGTLATGPDTGESTTTNSSGNDLVLAITFDARVAARLQRIACCAAVTWPEIGEDARTAAVYRVLSSASDAPVVYARADSRKKTAAPAPMTAVASSE